LTPSLKCLLTTSFFDHYKGSICSSTAVQISKVFARGLSAVDLELCSPRRKGVEDAAFRLVVYAHRSKAALDSESLSFQSSLSASDHAQKASL
jgi:hypothetical protein